jgi:hypothetical protein
VVVVVGLTLQLTKVELAAAVRVELKLLRALVLELMGLQALALVAVGLLSALHQTVDLVS